MNYSFIHVECYSILIKNKQNLGREIVWMRESYFSIEKGATYIDHVYSLDMSEADQETMFLRTIYSYICPKKNINNVVVQIKNPLRIYVLVF